MDQWEQADGHRPDRARAHQYHGWNSDPFYRHAECSRRREPRYALLKVRLIGGAPVTPKLARQAKDILNFDALQAVYGLTETMGGTTLSEFEAPIEVTCENKGKPIGEFEVKVTRNDAAKLAPIGEDGEIWVRGYTVMLGYYKNEEATREAINQDGMGSKRATSVITTRTVI